MATISKIKIPNITEPYDVKDSISGYATETYVDTKIEELPKPMIFKGSIGDGGTITWSELPTPSSENEGHVYKVITAHSTEPICKVGDQIISNGTTWVVIPSGDEPSGTVTSVGLQSSDSGTYGIEVGGTTSPITSSGTFTVGLNSATESKISEIDDKITNGPGAIADNSVELNQDQSSTFTIGTDSPSLYSGLSFTAGVNTDPYPAIYTPQSTTLDGKYSTVMNEANFACGRNSFAHGHNCVAHGDCSEAGGESTVAAGGNSRAMGRYTLASGFNSLAEGWKSIASGNNSRAGGYNNEAAGSRSYANGVNTKAYGENSFTSGEGNVIGIKGFKSTSHTKTSLTFVLDSVEGIAVGDTFSVINAVKGTTWEDVGTIATIDATTLTVTLSTWGSMSFSRQADEAYMFFKAKPTIGTTVINDDINGADNYGFNSAVFGKNNIVIGQRAFSNGFECQALSNNSFTSGYKNIASGAGAMANGNTCTANGNYSFTSGYHNTASGNYQAVFGKYNEPNSTDLIQIGNGTGDSAKSNAAIIDSSGNIKLNGDVYINCNADSSGGTSLTSVINSIPTTTVKHETIAVGSTSATIPYNGTYLSSYVTNASGKKVIVDETISSNNVLFELNSAATEALTCNVVLYNYIPDYLCFTANTANSTVELFSVNSPTMSDTSYSFDGINWINFTPSDDEEISKNKVTLAKVGDKVYFRNTPTYGFHESSYVYFVMSGSIAASGNVNSMYNAFDFEDITELEHENCFYSLFYGCTSLTTAPSLPATALSSYCYAGMFRNCTSLTTAPTLPATNLASYCYYGMFRNCTSLTTAPSLPATNLASYCYAGMFYGCTSLTTAPSLPATALSSYCYANMFNGCTSLTTAPSLPATTLASSCYYYMFYGCTSLITAPSLPATTLTSNCYKNMFYGCTSLITAPSLPATTLASGCYCYMFYSCTSLTIAPSLPATTLASSCYYYMFSGCTSLYVSDTSGTGYDKAWNIPSSGTFTNSTTYNQSAMFTNCLGTRSSNAMSGATGGSHTYYTQNTPV